MKLKEGMVCVVESAYYRQGRSSVDLVDARSNAQTGKDPAPVIDAAAEIFARFPHGRGK